MHEVNAVAEAYDPEQVHADDEREKRDKEGSTESAIGPTPATQNAAASSSSSTTTPNRSAGMLRSTLPTPLLLRLRENEKR